MRKVLIIDTSVLCVWLQVSGYENCGPDHDKWDLARVRAKLDVEKEAGATFVLPLASIIETGNHITKLGGDKFLPATRLAEVMKLSADQATPWAAFGDQAQLWSPEQLKILAEKWPPLAAQKLSLGDATIADVAEYYAKTGWRVEMLTGDQGLKAYEPTVPVLMPRRRRGSR